MPRGTRNRTTKKPQSEYKKKIVKIRAEINKIESKKQYKRSMNSRAVSLEIQRRLTNIEPDSSRKREDPHKYNQK